MSQKSLGSLCSVVKTLIVSDAGRTDQASKGQGHLLTCSGQLIKADIFSGHAKRVASGFGEVIKSGQYV